MMLLHNIYKIYRRTTKGGALYDDFTFIVAICAYCCNPGATDVTYCTHIVPVAAAPTFIVVPETPFTGRVIDADWPAVNPVL